MSATIMHASSLVDWLGTFAVHSTLALAALWLVALLLRKHALALQERLLRISLWIALVSATIQCSLGSSIGPEFVWSAAPAAVPWSDSSEPVARVEAFAAPAAPGEKPLTGLPWSMLIVIAAGASALLGLGWLFVVHRRLGSVLRARVPETDPRVLSTAAEVARSLGMQQSPHVSRSESITTPIAFGLLRPEICLPMRVGELSDASLRAMLAHEVAHLRAADPAWMWGAAWLQALFPWQPLFLIVRRRWARLVELRCDRIAGQHATPTAVARCLLDVAEWLRPGPEKSLVALGMAARPSALRERIEAALQGGTLLPECRGWARMLGGVVLAALTMGAPAVTTEPATAQPVTEPITLAEVRPSPTALQAALDALSKEHAHLVAEAGDLRAELGLRYADPQLMLLQSTIDRRLLDLSRRRARLEALLVDSLPSHR